MYGELPVIKTTNGDGEGFPALPIQITNPPKSACLRLPTTEEMLTYLGALRTLSRDLGRRKSQSEDVPNPKADAKLFNAIRLDKSGDEFDEAEISYALGLLTKHKVEGCERDGNGYVITLSTIFGKHIHTVREPMHKELREYQRNVYQSQTLPHGVEEQRFPPEVPAKLYDTIIVSASGYTLEPNVALDANRESVVLMPAQARTLVPPHHKRAVMLELVSMLASLDPVLDPNS